jgi:hypothetical protein
MKMLKMYIWSDENNKSASDEDWAKNQNHFDTLRMVSLEALSTVQ